MTGHILVTGAYGFVGRHLLTRLGDHAVPLDADVTDAQSVRRAVSEIVPDAVVHLAALSSVADSRGEEPEVWRVNVLGTVNLLEAVRAEASHARVLAVSTGQVYGDAEQLPTPEEAAVAPISPYAASKAAAELACVTCGLDVVVARPFQHEGPGRDDRFAVGSWTKQIAALELHGGGTIRVGDLTARRDLTDVRDVCRAYELMIDRAVPEGVYNVASGRAVEMGEVLELLIAQASCEVEIEIDPTLVRSPDGTAVCGDASKLTAATGWRPRVPLEQTLADTLDAARQAFAERIPST